MLLAGRGGTEGEAGEFPGGAHADDPAESEFLVVEGLGDVQEGGDAEEEGEDDGCGERWVVVVVGVAGVFGDVAVFVGGDAADA